MCLERKKDQIIRGNFVVPSDDLTTSQVWNVMLTVKMCVFNKGINRTKLYIKQPLQWKQKEKKCLNELFLMESGSSKNTANNQ